MSLLMTAQVINSLKTLVQKSPKNLLLSGPETLNLYDQ